MYSLCRLSRYEVYRTAISEVFFDSHVHIALIDSFIVVTFSQKLEIAKGIEIER